VETALGQEDYWVEVRLQYNLCNPEALHQDGLSGGAARGILQVQLDTAAQHSTIFEMPSGCPIAVQAAAGEMILGFPEVFAAHSTALLHGAHLTLAGDAAAATASIVFTFSKRR
jgi:hypothetical protein